jgi:hypothetical protein
MGSMGRLRYALRAKHLAFAGETHELKKLRMLEADLAFF